MLDDMVEYLLLVLVRFFVDEELQLLAAMMVVNEVLVMVAMLY